MVMVVIPTVNCTKSVDGDLILSRKVLGGARGEGLGKVDAAEPKHHWGTVVHPLPETCEAKREALPGGGGLVLW